MPDPTRPSNPPTGPTNPGGPANPTNPSAPSRTGFRDLMRTAGAVALAIADICAMSAAEIRYHFSRRSA